MGMEERRNYDTGKPSEDVRNSGLIASTIANGGARSVVNATKECPSIWAHLENALIATYFRVANGVVQSDTDRKMTVRSCNGIG